MAGVHISIDEHSFKQLQTKLTTLSRAADTLQGALSEIGSYLVSETTQRFKDSTSPSGRSWKAVKRGGKPLVNKGHLRDSIDYQTNNDSVEIGTNVIYAAIQHFGGRTGRNGSVVIYARPYLGINFQDEREIGAIVEKHILRALHRH